MPPDACPAIRYTLSCSRRSRNGEERPRRRVSSDSTRATRASETGRENPSSVACQKEGIHEVAHRCSVCSSRLRSVRLGRRRHDRLRTLRRRRWRTPRTSFSAALSPEQRQQATFAFDSEELTRWHYVPATQFPRNGLPIRAMNEAQRALAQELLKTGLSQRGYTQATTIMVDLEIILKALENGAAIARSRAVRLFNFRHTGRERRVGLARERASSVAALQRRRTARRWRARRRSSGRIRRKSASKGRRRDCASSAIAKTPARALLTALDATQRTTATLEGGRAERHRHEDGREGRSAVAGRPRRVRHDAEAARAAHGRDRDLHVVDGARHRVRAARAASHGRPRQDHVRVGRRSRSAARSTTTACRDRRS